MKPETFRGGVHPLQSEHHGKPLSNCCAITVMPAPDIVVIPMARVTGAACTPLVKKGDAVKMGQRIGESPAFVSAPIHSSVSGTVTAVETRPHPTGKSHVISVVIKNDQQDTPDESIQPCADVEKLTGAEIIAIIRDKGIVGMGGATFPTHVKLTIPKGKTVDTLIANAAECEPYLTADDRLLQERARFVVSGVKLALKALGIERALIGVEGNKPHAIQALREAATGTAIEVRPLRVKYPQGGEKQLIWALTRREVPSGGLPADAGCVVLNVGTLYAIHEAVVLGKPLIERVVTVTGGGVRNPSNLLVRIGTSFHACIEFCGGKTDDAAKILSGGPMMGVAQFSDAVPVIAGTSGIIVLSGEEAHVPPATACIRCGRCFGVCPIRLQPYLISDAVDTGDTARAAQLHTMDCVECGACTYICPARRQLLQNIRIGKNRIRGLAPKK